MKHLRLLILSTLLIATFSAAAQEKPWYERTRFNALIFGDYYWIAENHDSNLVDRNGFWIRRLYLTFDQTISDQLSARLRLEANHAGDFTNSGALDPYIKDAYVRWSRTKTQELYFGVIPTATWEFVESSWGYRHIEKTPMDLYRMGTARDVGVSMVTSLTPELRFHGVVGNGAGLGADIDTGKQAMAAVTWQPADRVAFQVYADFNDRAGNTDRKTLQAFLLLRGERARAGLQYITQDIERATGGSRDLDVASLFGVLKVSERVSLIGRYDRSFDPNPDIARNAYIPFDPSSEFNFFLLAADISLHRTLSVSPNVEIVTYDRRGGTNPDNDVIPRVTFFYRF